MKVTYCPKLNTEPPKKVLVSSTFDALYYVENPQYIKTKLKELTGESHIVKVRNNDDGDFRAGYHIFTYLLIDGFIEFHKNQVLIVRIDHHSDLSTTYIINTITIEEFREQYRVDVEDINPEDEKKKLIEYLKAQNQHKEISKELEKFKNTHKELK